MKPRIAASFTTCRRPLHFRRAYHSFKLHCLDSELIDDIFVIDDFSPEDDLKSMKRTALDARFLPKDVSQKGHAGSLNVLLEAVMGNYDFLVAMEDDFLYVKDENYVSRAIKILESDPQLGQVVFNLSYAETGVKKEKDLTFVAGSSVLGEDGQVSHVIHNYVGPTSSPEWKAFANANAGKVSNAHWPHFSLNNSVWNLHAMRDVGRFGTDGFEFYFAHRYMTMGLKTAFFPDLHCIHLGKLRPLLNDVLDTQVKELYEKHGLNMSAGVSAYDLNLSRR